MVKLMFLNKKRKPTELHQYSYIKHFYKLLKWHLKDASVTWIQLKNTSM